MHSHGFCTTEDANGRRWKYARAWRWLTSGSDDGWSHAFGAEWFVGPNKWVSNLGFKVSTSGEESLDVAIHLSWLGSLYLKWEGRTRRGPIRLWPQLRVSIGLRLSGVDWCFGPDDQSWDRDASVKDRLRRNSLMWWRVGRYRRDQFEWTSGPVWVSLDGKTYRFDGTLHREAWAWRVGPYKLTRRSKRRLSFFLPRSLDKTLWLVDMIAGGGEEGIPVPETWKRGAWVSNLTAPVSNPTGWKAEAARALRDRALEERARHGFVAPDEPSSAR